MFALSDTPRIIIPEGRYSVDCKGEYAVEENVGFEYPHDKTALAREDEYLLGNDLLISPIGGEAPTPLKECDYVAPVKATYYNGRELEGEPIAKAEYEKLDLNLNHVSPEKGVPVYDFSSRFETVVKFEKKVQLCIRCDDGATVYVDGKKVLEDKTLHSALLFPLCKLSANEEHTVEIEYFQAGGEASCTLCYFNAQKEMSKSVYLPAGRWLDAFTGKVYEGGNTVSREYALREMPLFVRLGAFVPLAHEARNTKEQKWTKLVYDFYPDKNAMDAGYLYEDDTETTAYKHGMYRKSAFKAGYCKECNAYVVNLPKAEGTFAGEKCFSERDITFKVHTFGEQVKCVTVNGQEVAFKTAQRDGSAFPLNAGDTAPDADTVLVTLKTQVEKDYEIKFYL